MLEISDSVRFAIVCVFSFSNNIKSNDRSGNRNKTELQHVALNSKHALIDRWTRVAEIQSTRYCDVRRKVHAHALFCFVKRGRSRSFKGHDIQMKHVLCEAQSSPYAYFLSRA